MHGLEFAVEPTKASAPATAAALALLPVPLDPWPGAPLIPDWQVPDEHSPAPDITLPLLPIALGILPVPLKLNELELALALDEAWLDDDDLEKLPE